MDALSTFYSPCRVGHDIQPIERIDGVLLGIEIRDSMPSEEGTPALCQ